MIHKSSNGETEDYARVSQMYALTAEIDRRLRQPENKVKYSATNSSAARGSAINCIEIASREGHAGENRVDSLVDDFAGYVPLTLHERAFETGRLEMKRPSIETFLNR